MFNVRTLDWFNPLITENNSKLACCFLNLPSIHTICLNNLTLLDLFASAGVLNKSKIGIIVKDILENENDANLGERAIGKTDNNPLVDVTADVDGSETEKEVVEREDHKDVIDNTLDEAEDSSNDESTESQLLESFSTAKIN